MIIVSPGLAGCVTKPGIDPTGCASVPSRLIAIAGPTPYCVVKIAGATLPTIAENAADTEPFTFTTTS